MSMFGKRGRPHIHGERLGLSAIHLEKHENTPYYMGCRKVTTNLWKRRTVYAYVTATDPDKPGSFCLFLCTATPEETVVHPEKQSDEKIRNYDAWGMLPLGLFSLRWDIETSYYETKTFWSFCDYMIRSVKGVERLTNLTCISYAAVRLLPYYSSEFKDYRGQSPQEIRYQLGEKIRMNTAFLASYHHCELGGYITGIEYIADAQPMEQFWDGIYEAITQIKPRLSDDEWIAFIISPVEIISELDERRVSKK